LRTILRSFGNITRNLAGRAKRVTRLATAKSRRKRCSRQKPKRSGRGARGRASGQPGVPERKRDLDATIKRIQALIGQSLEMQDNQTAGHADCRDPQELPARSRGSVGIREYDELMREKEMARREYEDLDKRLNTSGGCRRSW